MKKLMTVFMFIILLFGCSPKLSFEEINMNRVDKEVQNFIHAVEDENGTHLYYDNKQNIYVFLNGYHVTHGNEAVHFTGFNVEPDGDTLNISFEHDKTMDYSNQDLNNQLLYKVTLDRDYDTLKLFDNREETSFQSIHN